MSKVTLAKTAGFCFGVNRAVNMVYELAEKEKVCTLGPIIHNAEVVNELKEKGVIIADSPCDVKEGYTVVIRSHGVGRKVYDEISGLGLKYEDATCPFVSKIHKTVAKAGKENSTVIIGDKNHPEVKGIEGHCCGQYFTVKNHDEIENLVENHQELKTNKVTVVSQTTFDVSEWKKSLKIIKKVCTNAVIFDTICNATAERQEEARSLAEKSDLMIVIGDKTSSNTCKLYDICRRVCSRTYLVETSKELSSIDFSDACDIGVTAGASAPARIIKEVLDTMAENQVNSSEEKEQDFASMLEEHMQSYNTDGRVQGVVDRITPNEIYVDIVGKKQAGIVKLDELTNDPNAKAEDLVKVGDVLDLLIMRTNDQEGTVMLSKKRVDAQKGWDTVKAALESKEILTGVVTEVNKGGVIAVTDGTKVFIPASQATASKNEKTDGLLKQEVRFRIIDINDRRRRAVGSIRSVINEEKSKAREAFWAGCEVGKVYTGTVKSLTSYGAFVDIGGVDGMIHISELSWNRIKHPSEVVKVGDVVEVYVKDIDEEKKNISLGYKKAEDNPWEVLKNNYPVGTVAEVEIVGLTSFGAFAKIIPGIDGLIHISQIADRRIEKPEDELTIGQKVNAKVTAIDFDKKRVSLSIRALLEDSEDASDAEDEDNK